ncbi:MAG: GNAT family N-acetyltransferase, partial [Candidatus Omnitrophota bacterium]|nr:GNAT family N-acetyltransferase [Candidatus Omnitrophota bacterium]
MDMAVEGGFRKVLDAIKKFAPRIFSPRVVICGIPMGQGRIGIAGEAAPVLQAICKAMEKIAREHKAGIIGFKDFNSTYNDKFKDLLKDGFFQIQSLPSTDMRLNFADFQQYMDSLSNVSKSGLKRKFKKIDGKVKIDLEITDTIDDAVLAEVYPLYLQTHERQDIGMEKLGPDFFKNISRNMPGQIKYFLWRLDAKMVAFSVCFVSEDHFIDYYLGFDYALAYELGLYFIRFRDMMKWCLEYKIKVYEMGQTSYEAKRRLGFDFIRLYIYGRHRNSLINLLLKCFSRIVKPENFHPVFKEMDKIGV